MKLEPWFHMDELMEANEKLGLIVASAAFVVLAIVLWWDSKNWRRMK